MIRQGFFVGALPFSFDTVSVNDISIEFCHLLYIDFPRQKNTTFILFVTYAIY